MRAWWRQRLEWVLRYVFFIRPIPPPDARVSHLRGLIDQGGALTENEEHLAGLAVESYRYNQSLDRKLRRRTLESRVLYAFAVALSVISASLYDELNEQGKQQREGRRLGVTVTCAFGGALAEAGRNVLTRYARNDAERQAGVKAGRLYTDDIAAAVVRELLKTQPPVRIRGLVIRKGPRAGTLDCERLVRVVAAAR